MAPTDCELMSQVQAGQREAFGELVHRYERKLVNFFFRRVWDQNEAEDMAQEVFLRLYHKRSDYTPRAKFSTFLFRVATNLWIDWVRGHARTQKPVSLDSSGNHPNRPGLGERLAANGPTPEAAAGLLERRGLLQQALEQLSEDHRVVVVLGEIEEMRYEDIAEILSIPVGTVKSRMFTAMRRLREILSKYKDVD